MRLSLIQKLENAHDDSLWTVAWAPNSNILITGSVDESVKLWQEGTDTLEQQHHLSGVSLGAVSVAVDSTGTYGAVNSLDSTINIWRMDDYRSEGDPIKQAPSESWGIAFAPRSSPDDPILLAIAGGSSHTVQLWDANAGKSVLTLPMPANEEKKRKDQFVLSVAISPDGKRIAAGAMDGCVAVFDLESGQHLHRLEGHFKPVRGLAFTPDSKHLLTACDDMHAGLFDVEGGALIESFSGHESWVLDVAAHPDGSAFATGGSDGKVVLWDLKSRTCAQTLAEHADQVWGVAWRADGSKLASVSDDRSICVYDFA